MNTQQRLNVQTVGRGRVTMVFAHGFGCDQTMWRRLIPAFADRYRIVLYDLAGCGQSNLAAWNRDTYATLHGHARDVLDVIAGFADAPVIFVGHSVSTMSGMLASIAAPEHFLAQLMLCPSPCYINDGDYSGGFSRRDIDELLDTMDSNYLGWSSRMAPAIMGAPAESGLSQELTQSFCRTDPSIARHFGRVTFMSDHRADVAQAHTPALIVQCRDDLIAPVAVGEFMQRTLPAAKLTVIDNIGHCPHLSAPEATGRAMADFLEQLDV